MGDKSAIEWTDATWNVLRGCSRVSAGCTRCYAERDAGRMSSVAYKGLVKKVGGEWRWTGEVRFVPEALDLPLRWKQPRRVFVNSMSDLFHEKVPDEWIDQVFAVMAQTPRHTYQILTKRPERMREYGTAMATLAPRDRSLRVVASMYRGHPAETLVGRNERVRVGDFPWPLGNVWLGVSVEDQATADARIQLLLQTPAAVRWVSAEPMLGPISLSRWLPGAAAFYESDGVQWVVAGGESGPGARPCDVAWIRSLRDECHHQATACFIKQLGARPVGLEYHEAARLRDRKGGSMEEWPRDLRVREFPAPTAGGGVTG